MITEPRPTVWTVHKIGGFWEARCPDFKHRTWAAGGSFGPQCRCEYGLSWQRAMDHALRNGEPTDTESSKP